MRMHVDVTGSHNPSFRRDGSLAGIRINFPNGGNLPALYGHITVEPGIPRTIDQPATVNHDIEFSHYPSSKLTCSSPYTTGDKTTTTVVFSNRTVITRQQL